MYKKELDKMFSSYNERTLSVSWYLVVLSIDIPFYKKRNTFLLHYIFLLRVDFHCRVICDGRAGLLFCQSKPIVFFFTVLVAVAVVELEDKANDVIFMAYARKMLRA